MRRHQLEHVVAAAANVTREDELVVVGSQAILGTYPDAPEPLLRSMEADLYPRWNPSKADEIDGALGDGSQFHRTYGYYAHGVGPETAKAPAGWEKRLVRVSVAARPTSDRRPVALCLERHDLILAKCAAGRDRDWEFVREMLRACLAEVDTLLSGVEEMPIGDAERAGVRAMLTRIVAAQSSASGC